jgi:hypothetical protein
LLFSFCKNKKINQLKVKRVFSVEFLVFSLLLKRI